ncbi:hypothetical protein I317_01591 [Kwoniella heveanensis CBS 569]|nr:hypothetical protein I317_01591 [Kwoniella heveanensis CBS 569]
MSQLKKDILTDPEAEGVRRYDQETVSNDGYGDAPPPPYWKDESDPAQVSASGPGMTSHAAVDDAGQVDITLKLHRKLPELPASFSRHVKEYGVDPKDWMKCPPLNIVIFIVGSRGDVQPYISLALSLIRTSGHRVRIATHGEFATLVLEGNLEFFDVGGDPKELMAYMVKNPGLLPGYQSLINGDIPSKRKMTAQMLRGFYQSCLLPDTASGEPFAAEAIISNPPAFAHVHVAEALGLPLLMSFTMPWSPTTAFRHPLANIRETNAEPGLSNYLSYSLVDNLTWQGLGHVINNFRLKVLGLDAVTSRTAPSLIDRLRVPWTYCWSESLVPKPKDWKENIDISGFYFYETNSNYEPDPNLLAFLKDGPSPFCIGFGSIVIDKPKEMTEMIYEAVRRAGVRALICAGWAGLGEGHVPDGVYVIKGNIPHDWLFAEGRVSAVCHHGGAGTTAIGLRNGLPTIIVPFFGDQKFWGEMIHSRGAGPAPIPQKQLNADNLTAALEFVMTQEAQAAAQTMGEEIRAENGEKKGVDSFHRHLPLLNMRCDIDPSRVAIWWSDELCLKLSGAVAGLLAQEGKVNYKQLVPHRPREYETDRHHDDVWTGGVASVFHVVTYSLGSVAELFYRPAAGTINTFWGIPKAAMSVVGDIYEGFDNAPALMGSETREKGKVTNFSSGLKEGGKGLFWGVVDAVTGLVSEPIAGGINEGPKGVLKGVGRSYVNLLTRPAAGSLGLFVLPAIGISRSTAKLFHKAPEGVFIAPRTDISHREASKLTPSEREIIIGRFKVLEPLSKKRRNVIRRRAKRFLLLPEKEKENVRFLDGLADLDQIRNGTPGISRRGSEEDMVTGTETETASTLNSAEERELFNRLNEARAKERERQRDLDEMRDRLPASPSGAGSASGPVSRQYKGYTEDNFQPWSTIPPPLPPKEGADMGLRMGLLAEQVEAVDAFKAEIHGDDPDTGKSRGAQGKGKERASTVPAFSSSASEVGEAGSPSALGELPSRATTLPTPAHERPASAHTRTDSTSSASAHAFGYQRRKAEREAHRKGAGWG